MWLGAPFPSHPSAGPHHLIIQEGRWSGCTSDFSMQSCISAPCSNFLPHQCSSYPALSVSVGLSKHSSSLGLCAGENTGLGALCWGAEGTIQKCPVVALAVMAGPGHGALWTTPRPVLGWISFPACAGRKWPNVQQAGALPALLGAPGQFPMCHHRELIKAGPWHRLLCTALFPHIPHQNSLSFCMSASSSAGPWSREWVLVDFDHNFLFWFEGCPYWRGPGFLSCISWLWGVVCQPCWVCPHEKRCERIKCYRSAGKRVRNSSAIPVEMLKALEGSPAAISEFGLEPGRSVRGVLILCFSPSKLIYIDKALN